MGTLILNGKKFTFRMTDQNVMSRELHRYTAAFGNIGRIGHLLKPVVCHASLSPDVRARILASAIGQKQLALLYSPAGDMISQHQQTGI